MDFFTRLVGRTLAQRPVAQPLIAPRFAAGPAVTAENAPEVEARAGGSEPPGVSMPRDSSAFPLDSGPRPPLTTMGTPHQTVPASGERPASAEHLIAVEREQPSLLPPALKPETAASEHPMPTAQHTAPGHVKPKPVQISENRFVQGAGESQVSGQAGSIILRPAQPDGSLEREHQSNVPSRTIIRDQSSGSSLELEHLRQTPEEPFESRGAVRALLPEQPASSGSEETTALLDVQPNITAGSAPIGATSEGRAAIRPEASPQPPTIRVTIGRVEVQAVMPPAPAPVFAPPARHEPRLSLDDYLKQRDEGQR